MSFTADAASFDAAGRMTTYLIIVAVLSNRNSNIPFRLGAMSC